MKRDSQILLGVGNGVMAGALWGGVFIAPQILKDFLSSQLSAARYLVYGAIALILLATRWRALSPKLGRREWLALIWLSLLGNIIYYVLLGRAVQLVGGASTSLIIGLLPVVVTLVGARDDGAVALQKLILPLLLCCIGVGLVGFASLHGHASGVGLTSRMLGLLCAFGALASWATYAVGNSRCLDRLPDISAHDWSLLTGVVTGGFSVILGAFVLNSPAGHRPIDWVRFWSVSAAVAIFASIVGNGFWNRASRLLPLTMTGQMIVFETLFALLYGFMWERRLPSATEMAAIVFLIGGVLWCASIHRSPGDLPRRPIGIADQSGASIVD